ncbi:TetR/AcrR family transcriptional regulator [Marinicella litoralis]|uniref:TetR family transcriptional regulator n=1 Tax=Marinicella litoralis TaxID=644220 RepID=A0A4V3DIV6_9GAMM|nr:TetR/AcrR family transcriptional regulator [Marinicella litoralis]TDR23371.1 TetR family transcriptional regulator [Marinicella litoralis]
MTNKKNTKDLILDAAEKLFAVRGFYGVSIRQITAEADVDPALASYHFGKKNDIFDAVMLRRAEILNRERIQMLDDCIRRAQPNPAPLHEIIDAFTHALLNRSNKGGTGWKSYFAIIAQINNHPELGGVIMTQYFDPLAKKFLDAIHATMPAAEKEDLFWCYHFLSGALTLTFSGTERISNLSDGLCQSSNLDAVHERLVPFITAGFEAFKQQPNKTP